MGVSSQVPLDDYEEEENCDDELDDDDCPYSNGYDRRDRRHR